jgi:TonB family protein
MLEQLERQETREQLAVPRLEITAPVAEVENDQRQRRRMVIALVMLLVALGLVLVKDRDFWFPAADATDSEAVEDSTPSDVSQPAATADTHTTPAATLATPVGSRRAHSTPAASTKSVVPEASASPVVTATRAVLPPLRVEVVAGDRHQLVRPGSPSVKVELQSGTAAQPASDSDQAGTEMAGSGTAASVTNAGDRVQMSTDTRQALSRPVRPEYPLLARQMKVQGAVVLELRIGKDGGIQSMQVSSGPAILADAAREAVKQWRFKPYFHDGQPVETQARVTVDFTIRAN